MQWTSYIFWSHDKECTAGDGAWYEKGQRVQKGSLDVLQCGSCLAVVAEARGEGQQAPGEHGGGESCGHSHLQIASAASSQPATCQIGAPGSTLIGEGIGPPAHVIVCRKHPYAHGVHGKVGVPNSLHTAAPFTSRR